MELQDLEQAQFASELEVRSVEERIVSARLVAWGETILLRGRRESFAKGAFAGLDPANTVALVMHDRTKPVGRMVAIEERDDGAYADFKIARTAAGDEALTLAQEGVYGAVSVGFIPGDQTSQGVHTRIKKLPEVSLVTSGFAAYQTAQVLATRSEETMEPTPETIETPEAQVVDLAPLQTRMEEMATEVRELRTIASAITSEPEPETRMSPVDWFRREVRIAADLETRAAPAEMEGTLDSGDGAGLVQSEYIASQLVNVLDARRPFFSRTGSFPGPKSGYARIPVVTTHTLVDGRSTQFADANTRAMVVEELPFTAKWHDGVLAVSLELIQTSDPSALSLVWDDLAGQYAINSEADCIADVEAAATGDADDLPFTTYGAFAAAVATQAIVVRQATGAPATKLALPWSMWPGAVAFIDGNDRRQFTAGDHSDGSVALTGESFGLPGGLEVFAAGVTKPILYNESAIRTHDYGITKVEATVVQTMSREVGVLGRTMIVPRIPAGIVVFDTESSSSSSGS